MTSPTTVALGPLATAARATAAALRVADGDLVAGFREQLAHAAGAVSRRVMGALVREGMIDPGALPGEHHAFGRIEPRPAELDGVDPAALLLRLAGAHPGADAVSHELTDAAVNLAVALARRERDGAPPTDLFTDAALDPDERCAALEKLAIEGHNLHPCARTRLGWSVPDLLAYDLEAPDVEVGFVGVRREVHIGDDLGALLEPGLVEPGRTDGLDLDAFAVTPVHGWLAGRIAAGRYADLVAAGLLVPLTGRVAATPTAALRTLLLPRDATGPRYLKLSLDIQVTSTRRTISIASTRNGPVLSRLLDRLLTEGPGGRRVLLMAETAGAATRLPGGRDRELSAIARTGLTGRLEPGELAVPGAALYAPTPYTGEPVVAALVDRYAVTRALADRPSAALGFLDEYAGLLLPPVLGLAARHGIGLEAHLQNCVPTFVGGVPHRLAVRDLAGLRVYAPRLASALTLWPGSVIIAEDVETMLAKVAYTALQAHLGELVVRLVGSHGLDEPAAWARVRERVDAVYDGLRADPATAARAAYDQAFLTAATVPHKALLRMRLAAGRGRGGDEYVRVENPLR